MSSSLLIQQLKLCKVDGYEKGTSPLSTISHIFSLFFSEDISTRDIGAKNGLVGIHWTY